MDQQYPQAHQRLDSWKEIASYLDRSVRTVRRWEEKEGLPVHRHQHDKGSTVFAHREELDRWLEERRSETVPSGLSQPSDAQVNEPLLETEPRRALHLGSRPLGLALVAAAVALLIATSAAFWFGLWDVRPAGFGAANDGDQEHWVLITDFENRTDNELFEGLVEYALEREVSNSEQLRVVPKERIAKILSLMRKPSSTLVDRTIGREICERDAEISGLLVGRVETLGKDFLLSVDLVDPLQGETVANLSRQFNEGQHLLPTLHQLAREVRETLTRTLPQVALTTRPAREMVTTASSDALELYTRAERLIEGDSPAPAAVLLEQAIETDPSFASAHIQLAWLDQRFRRPQEEVERHAQNAFARLDGLSDVEKLFIQGSYAHLRGEHTAADASYRALLSIDPSHYWGNQRAFDACRELRPDESCVPYRIRLANRRPDDFRAHSEAAWALAVLDGDPEKAQRYADRAQELIPAARSEAYADSVVLTELFPIYRSWLAGDYAATEELRDRIESTFDQWSPPVQDGLARELGANDLAFGKLASAKAWFERINDPVDRHEMQALVLFARGDKPALKAHLAARSTYREPMTAVLLAMSGMPDRATALIETLEASGLPAAYTKVAKGQLAMMSGDTEGAIELLSQGAEEIPTPAQAMYFAALDMQAGVLHTSGNLNRAIEVLEMTSRMHVQSAFAGSGLFWTKCQFRLVQMYRAMDRLTEAKKLEIELRQKLIDADCDYPIYAELNAPAGDDEAA